MHLRTLVARTTLCRFCWNSLIKLRPLSGQKKVSPREAPAVKERPSSTLPFATNNEFSLRTHNCGQLRAGDEGENVTLCGWVQFQRMGKFITLRDAFGSTQLIVPDSDGSTLRSRELAKLPFESVILAEGQVKLRPEKEVNLKMATGEVEVELNRLQVLSECKRKLPFQVRDFHRVKESLRLQHRYLDLRNVELQRNLRLRSELVSKMRHFFSGHGFVEVETPTLFKATPGGAHEFVVPTRSPGKYYNLTQSPQQFKQLLMVGGIDRYYQIARCYRDEGAKPERQPEFTQVDLEMSFTSMDGILSLVESLMKHCWPSDKGAVDVPFRRMTYCDAINNYGTDKPDVRFEMKLKDLTAVLRNTEPELLGQNQSCIAISVPMGSDSLKGNLNRLKQLFNSTCRELSFGGKVIGLEVKDALKGNAFWETLKAETRDGIQRQLSFTPGDYLWLALGEKETALALMGKIRLECARCLLEDGAAPYGDRDDPAFLWVVDFPLFLPKEGEPGQIESAHHPFTAPREEDAHILRDSPLDVKGQHFDLVLEGQEVGGGSMRINDADLQSYVFENVLKEDVSSLSYFMEALESGCPPHGGIALGLDRLAAIICKASSIRDVMAFPKSSEGKDLMSGAPSLLDVKTKALYHIKD